MASFTFRLETVLKLRERLRDECRARLQQAEQAVNVLEEQAAAVTEQLSELGMEASTAAAPGTINVDRLVDYRRYGMVLQAQLQQLHQQREQVEQEASKRRTELTEADREVKVLEKLKQRQRVDYDRRQHYAEIKQLDEVAGRIGGRRNS